MSELWTQAGGLTGAADEVATVFGLGDVDGPLELASRGEQGVVWRLDTSTGPYAVKELLRRQSESDVGADVSFQEAASAGSSVIAPRTMRTEAGALLADVAGRQVRVQTWLDLASPTPDLDPALVGCALAELHLVGQPRSDAVDEWYTAAVGKSRWQQHVLELDARDAPIAERIARAVPLLSTLESLLVPPRDLRTCHRDLWADNMRCSPTGDVCVIDWDNCGPADPAHELGMVLFEFAYESEARCRTLYDAYRDAGGPGRLEQPGDFTMLIAQFGHFYELAIMPWLEREPTTAALARSLDRLAELEDPPLTLRGLERMLRAVGAAP